MKKKPAKKTKSAARAVKNAPPKTPPRKTAVKKAVVIPPKAKNIPIPKVISAPPTSTAAMPKASWADLPRSIPVPVRFLLQAAQKECAAAASWPFPLAKFLSSLPLEFCGKEVSLLVMSLSHGTDEIARITGIAESEIKNSLNHLTTNIDEKFSSECRDIYRKWSGSRASAESLIEPYQIARVDKNFQILFGEIVMRSIRRASPNTF